MEWLVWMVLFIFILACVLYFIIKAAVRDGMLAYDQIKRQEEQAGNGEMSPDTQTESAAQTKKEDG
ncbi:unknown [Clostridium sp. CAG:1013]|nr:unknown [Clostridium sp. CAG:1013]